MTYSITAESGVVAIRWRIRYPECQHSARDPYVERFWLPTIGPTPFALLRRIALDQATTGAEDCVYPTDDLAKSIGVSPRRLLDALRRCAQFGFAEETAPFCWDVDVLLPPVSRRHYHRLPPGLVAELVGATP